MCFGIRPASPLPRPMETGRRQNKDGMGRETGPCQRSAGISAPDDGTKRMENLNGLWDYAIRPCGEAEPKTYDGEILVPFAVESSLSGVGVHLEDSQELWYTRQFEVPAGWKGKRVLLHFGAVDWRAHVWVNNTSVGKHEGGYTPFLLRHHRCTAKRKQQTDRTCMGPHQQWSATRRKTSQPPARHLVYSRLRHLADCVARTGKRKPYSLHENHTRHRPQPAAD